jgi:5-methyltetrahydropteroyltriglutamate--homocysteine methyltransferase
LEDRRQISRERIPKYSDPKSQLQKVSMNRTTQPLQTTVIGSYPFPSWLEYACQHLDQFGADDLAELQDDAVRVAIHDQREAGLDVITDGEQTRLDFNLSFYGYLQGIKLEDRAPRQFGPPAHDQRGKHQIVGNLSVSSAEQGLGAVAEFQRLKRLAAVFGCDRKPILKASVPGPYTMSGRLIPNADYPDRFAITEALLPLIRQELISLVEAGCQEITVDEPSMSCYAHREDPSRFVDIFNRTIAQVKDRCRLSTHLCFGNYKGHAVAPRRYSPMFPAFLQLDVDEIHLEMASREFAELDLISQIAEHKNVAVGIIDVKSYFIEPVEEIARRVRQCLEFAPADRLSFAPDCGLSQTARWAARQKLKNMVAGVQQVRDEVLT